MTLNDSDLAALKEQYPVSDDVAKANRKGNPASALERLSPAQWDNLKKEAGIGRGNKYHAVRTESVLCGRVFDSKAEARRGEELYLLEKAGQIKDLQYQVSFRLCEKPRIRVTIDFLYFEELPDLTIKNHYEDVKGVLTRDSRTKYAWLKEKHGVEVELIKS